MKPYKGNRKHEERPIYYDAIIDYMAAKYNTVMCEGLEADDMLSVTQRNALKEGKHTIICSRDKDLRIVPGNHYGWECGKQEQFGPTYVEPFGELTPVYRGELRSGEPKLDSLKGSGILFFYAQMIMGDSTDNIPGVPRKGAAIAYRGLKDCKDEQEAFEFVKSLYVGFYGEFWQDAMEEQGRLLWMVDKLDEDGKPVMWTVPKYLED